VSREYPTTLTLETSVKCNSQCIMCPSASLERDDMSLEFAESVIDQLASWLPPQWGLITIPCGNQEPLLWPHLIELLEYSRLVMPGSRAGFSTNAALLDEEMAKALIEVGFSRIAFSVDGANKETYESIRVGLDYDVVVENIRRFMQLNKLAGSPIVQRIHFTEMRSNYTEVSAFADFWMGEGFNRDQIGFLGCDNRAERVGGEPTFSLGASNDPCYQPFHMLSVLCNGEVGMCCLDYGPAEVLGNLHEQSVEEVWNGGPLECIRNYHTGRHKAVIPKCRECTTRR